uniref:Uncharacterized protein n=1 Tax=Chromera velia CCMP2878 TaxID=1169474 RepID=A0A0G4IAR3_9ALVE|eukprot:Cvel_12638.t1-p1 / transcript=Cvel_12638.t1 / gene=Cvel_12638 / organism=Chromera_velia_CCMP2878 / gene_product=hypothetical protein / transcript_product=hypothetical protein / location=Cvel_scaffold834:55730-56635(+) / protein_length=302 / sequence_SO=supercontig / SO=protein_coding / is_pseudo=false
MQQLDVLATLAKLYKARGLPMPEKTDQNVHKCIAVVARMRTGPARFLFDAPSPPQTEINFKSLAKPWGEDALIDPLEYLFVFSQLLKRFGEIDANYAILALCDIEEDYTYDGAGLKSYAEVKAFWSKFEDVFGYEGDIVQSLVIEDRVGFLSTYDACDSTVSFEVRRFPTAPRQELDEDQIEQLCQAAHDSDLRWPSWAGGPFGTVFSQTCITGSGDSGWVDSDATFVDVLSGVVDEVDEVASKGWWPAVADLGCRSNAGRGYGRVEEVHGRDEGSVVRVQHCGGGRDVGAGRPLSRPFLGC